MDRYFARISTLLVEPNAAEPTVCKVFVAKPSAEKEIAVGKLFGIADFAPAGTGTSNLATHLLDQVKNDLYAAAPARHDPLFSPPTIDLDENFSAVLQRANGMVARFIEAEHVSLDLSRTSILLGNIRQQQLTLAAIGKVSGFLFHYRPNHDYQIVTIAEPNPDAAINPLRLFAQTVSGSAGPLDYLFFCTESILDYLSLHTIKSAITRNMGAEAVRQLKLAIAKANPQSAAAALIINLVLQRQAAPPVQSLKNINFAEAAARDSMRVLDQTRHATNRVLSPRLLPDKKIIARWLQNIFGGYFTRRQRPGGKPAARTASPAPFAPETHAPDADDRRARNNPAASPTPARATAGRIIGSILLNPIFRTIGAGAVKAFRALWLRFRERTLRQQLIILGTILVVGILGFNLFGLAANNSKSARDKAFARILAQVEQLRDASEAARIYRDEGAARQRLNDALQLLQQLPAEYEKHLTIVRDRRDINTKLTELRHEVVVSDPLQLANFSNLDEQAKTPAALVRINDSLYTQNTKTKTLLALNLNRRTIAEVTPDTALRAALLAGANADKSALLLDADSRLYRLDAAEQVHPIALTLPGGKISAFSIFHNRLYLLNAVGGTIFRSDAAGSSYAAPRPWLVDTDIDLRSTVDLAVDGDVYVLGADGSIVQLRQGRVIDFTLQSIDPPLAGPTKIKTFENSPYIYLLDPPTKRLVIVRKTGELVRQYRSALFDQLHDFIVDEPSKTVYLLNGTAIFGLPMEQLN